MLPESKCQIMIFPHGGILYYIPCKFYFLETLACEFNFRGVHLEYYPMGKIMICHFNPGASNVNLRYYGHESIYVRQQKIYW